jgi:hypothetical protein
LTRSPPISGASSGPARYGAIQRGRCSPSCAVDPAWHVLLVGLLGGRALDRAQLDVAHRVIERFGALVALARAERFRGDGGGQGDGLAHQQPGGDDQLLQTRGVAGEGGVDAGLAALAGAFVFTDLAFGHVVDIHRSAERYGDRTLVEEAVQGQRVRRQRVLG